jgi:hypothetical protein
MNFWPFKIPTQESMIALPTPGFNFPISAPGPSSEIDTSTVPVELTEMAISTRFAGP